MEEPFDNPVVCFFCSKEFYAKISNQCDDCGFFICPACWDSPEHTCRLGENDVDAE